MIKLKKKPGAGLWLLCTACMLALLPMGWAALQAPPLQGNVRAHDPSTIIKCKDKYYLFFTGPGIPSKWSSDKVNWSAGPHVFETAPQWTFKQVPGFKGTFWAPDVIFLNGRYCLYYAVSTFGGQVSAIGLATNPTLDPHDPAYHWTDQGPVITSTNGGPYNTIDPSIALDAAGHPWMSFGSYWNGIYMVQLDPQMGNRISADSPTYHLAYNNSIEASCIYQHDGYYYLFVDWGSCCSGVNSTYNIRIGRSTNMTGPYLDRYGIDLAANGGSLFLQGTGRFTGPGHVGILSENGRQWFSYHYYDAGAYAPQYHAFGVAKFDLEPLAWSADHWPYFTNDWSAFYNFQTDARDVNGQYYGVLKNGASLVTDSAHGHVLNLDGTNQFVELPPGVAFARTFTMVVKWHGGADGQRLFDFGVDKTRYLMLCPRDKDGKLRGEIHINNITQAVTANTALPTNVWMQVALTLDGQQGIIYVNGEPVGSNAVSLSPLDVLSQTNALGMSKLAEDPFFSGQFAEFRVYGRVLAPSEVTAPQPIILSPTDGSIYAPGATIPFSGSATDFRAVPLPRSHLTWSVNYVEGGRTNLLYGPVNDTAPGAFTLPTTVVPGGVYQFVVQAKDDSGRTGSAMASLFPANPATP